MFFLTKIHFLNSKLWTYFAIVFSNNFLFSMVKEPEIHVWQPETVFYFMFLRIENKVFSKKYFLIVLLLFFTYFLSIVLRNNYINIK